ncbi:Flp pilus assembly protein CpaB [Variovorax beijingensis]|uniref:Flp pilus assembly protein CpaB n=1 Tax=Variovorax beijingensis TaxID=2496117 RepID=A0A3P3EMH3_9BURK|nr:Flp pilus assembly protein CpaB [Variovorax beijingensis]RRH86578.1 Flp pilus assembly protein CpaB [Variovorax beijingensis]RSZ31703.1 Flp pilus assembly protein CpaB [Variovorax beijingensis]
MINLTKIIAAILVLLALALGSYAWLLSRQPPPPVAVAPSAAPGKAAQAQTFPVVVAAKPLPAGQAIPADALRIERLTINPVGAFQETGPLAGRVPVIDLSEGTPLFEGQLVSGLALRVTEGERAVAIKADEIMGVGNKVQPGDFVDVFLMLKSDGKDIDRSQARLLLSRKRVLAYGSASVDGLPSKMDKNGGAQQQAQRAEAARTAVLAVPVDDINRLTLAENSGRLLLALRNPTDMSEPDPKLFAELPTALQPPPPKAGEPRRPPLEGLDRAQAGVTTADFVTGGKPGALRAPAIAAVRTPTARTSGSRGGLKVEVIRGDRSETINY